MARSRLDARGLVCPLPVLRARKALRPLASGDELEVLATDPATAADFPAFCSATGDQLVETERGESMLRFVIRKA